MNKPNKLHLGQFPTPMHHLDNMSRALGRSIYIKRDDMTGVSTGGNKVRKLEYLLYDAKEKGADYVLTTGGAQSNHAMLTAACCNKIGIKAILVLKQRGVQGRVGNLLINELLGADVRFVDTDSYDDVYKEMDRIADELRAAGHNPYLVPVGGSVPLGTVGYVDCAREIFAEALEQDIKIDRIVSTAGSGGTLAGLVLGAMLYGDGCKVTGVAVCDDPFEEITAELVNGAAEILGADVHVEPKDIDILRYYGAGYAKPSKEGLEAHNAHGAAGRAYTRPRIHGQGIRRTYAPYPHGQNQRKRNGAVPAQRRHGVPFRG